MDGHRPNSSYVPVFHCCMKYTHHHVLQFQTNQYLNGSMAVNTSGVQHNVTCSNPAQLNLDTNTGTPNYTLTATSTKGCTLGPANFDPNSATALYGVTPIANCTEDLQTDPEFMPVFFWFYQDSKAAGVFCAPTLQLFNVTAHASLQNGTLTSVDEHSDFARPNNVTGEILHGPVRAFNGYIASLEHIQMHILNDDQGCSSMQATMRMFRLGLQR